MKTEFFSSTRIISTQLDVKFYLRQVKRLTADTKGDVNDCLDPSACEIRFRVLHPVRLVRRCAPESMISVSSSWSLCYDKRLLEPLPHNHLPQFITKCKSFAVVPRRNRSNFCEFRCNIPVHTEFCCQCLAPNSSRVVVQTNLN